MHDFNHDGRIDGMDYLIFEELTREEEQEEEEYDEEEEDD